MLTCLLCVVSVTKIWCGWTDVSGPDPNRNISLTSLCDPKVSGTDNDVVAWPQTFFKTRLWPARTGGRSSWRASNSIALKRRAVFVQDNIQHLIADTTLPVSFHLYLWAFSPLGTLGKSWHIADATCRWNVVWTSCLRKVAIICSMPSQSGWLRSLVNPSASNFHHRLLNKLAIPPRSLQWGSVEVGFRFIYLSWNCNIGLDFLQNFSISRR